MKPHVKLSSLGESNLVGLGLVIESESFDSNPTKRSTGFRDPTLLTVGQPNRSYIYIK